MDDIMYRGLLFALYAVRNGFLSTDQLLASLQAWVADRTKTLDDILVELLALTDRQRRILWPLIDLVLEKYEGDEARALECQSWAAPIRDAVQPLVNDDAEVVKLVAMIGAPNRAHATQVMTRNDEEDPWATWLPDRNVDLHSTLEWRDMRSPPSDKASTEVASQAANQEQSLAEEDGDPHATLFEMNSDSTSSS